VTTRSSAGAYVTEMVATVERTAGELRKLDEHAVSSRPGPGKWSIKEIIGHLIDSASNNHQRFVRAQWSDDLVCPTYDQDAWVTTQSYQTAPWKDLVELWRGYNLHLARVMAAIPSAARLRERTRHNLDRVAFRTVPADRPVTLDYFMRDYVEHMKHHLGQIAARQSHR
jgi:uncharacterized damage-inducible protein DinB